jgi:hypothetical protein
MLYAFIQYNIRIFVSSVDYIFAIKTNLDQDLLIACIQIRVDIHFSALVQFLVLSP